MISNFLQAVFLESRYQCFRGPEMCSNVPFKRKREVSSVTVNHRCVGKGVSKPWAERGETWIVVQALSLLSLTDMSTTSASWELDLKRLIMKISGYLLVLWFMYMWPLRLLILLMEKLSHKAWRNYDRV